MQRHLLLLSIPFVGFSDRDSSILARLSRELSIPFVGFKIPVPSIIYVLLAETFNSICWIQIVISKDEVMKLYDLSIPFVGFGQGGAV